MLIRLDAGISLNGALSVRPPNGIDVGGGGRGIGTWISGSRIAPVGIVGVLIDGGVDELTEPWTAGAGEGEGEGERLETLSAGLRGLGDPPLAVFVKGAPRRGEVGTGT